MRYTYITVQHGRQKLLNAIFTTRCPSTRHLIVRKILESLFWILFNEANSFVHKNITRIQHTNFSFNNQDSILRPDSKEVQTKYEPFSGTILSFQKKYNKSLNLKDIHGRVGFRKQPVTVTENYKRNVYKRKHYSGEMKTYK